MRFYQHKSHGIIALPLVMPHVSYLITLYNKAKFLPGVVAALAAQQGDFTREFVFVDDGSTDNTVAILQGLIVQYALPAQMITQFNQGPAAAFNAGLAHCNGEWLKPVDGDDILLPDATLLLLKAAQNCGTDIAFAPMELQSRYILKEADKIYLFPLAEEDDMQSVMGEGLTDSANTPHPNTKLNDVSLSVSTLSRKGRGIACRKIEPLMATLKNAQTNPTIWFAKTVLVKNFDGCDPAVFIQDYSLELELAQHGNWAQLDAEIMQQPEVALDRLSDNQAQTLHDVNFALLRFLQRHQQELPAAILKQSIKRAAKRAFNWARRRGTWQHVWQFLPIYLAAMLGGISIDAAVIEKLCKPFRQTAAIRRPQ